MEYPEAVPLNQDQSPVRPAVTESENGVSPCEALPKPGRLFQKAGRRLFCALFLPPSALRASAGNRLLAS